MKKWILILLLALTSMAMLGGCAAPGEVQVAQKYQKQIFTAYLKNNTLIFNTWATIFERQYKTAIDATLENDIADMRESAPSGSMPVAEIEKGVRTLVQARDIDFEKMRLILAKMEEAIATNNLEFEKAMEITEGLNKWMNTGVDSSVINGMADSLVPIIESVLKLDSPKGAK